MTCIDDGLGPAVLLLHGFSLDSRMWRPQIAGLSAQWRCVAPDLPGFGPGAPTEGSFVLADELARVLDERGVDRAHVVGLSLGGAVAIDLALARPDRVATIVLIDALLLGRRPGRPIWPKLVELTKSGRLAEAKALWCEDDGMKARGPHAYDAMCAMVADYAGGHWAGTLQHLWFTEDVAPRLASIAQPALVLVGEHDLPGFHAMADEYAAALPRATKAVVPGAGHLASMEQPDWVTARMRAFLESIDAS